MEIYAFLIVTAVLMPALAVATVGSYGMDGQDRSQDAGVEGSLGKDFRYDRYAGKIPRPSGGIGGARMGADEGERLA
jgi:hypothetical protein